MEVPDFGENPGDLRMWMRAPEGDDGPRPLVLFLHGCLQDHGAAEAAGFDGDGYVLVAAEQRATNNADLCFDWFDAGDTTRGAGEVASLRGMIAAASERADVDPHRVWVAGLSAGAAMAVALLATYPDVLAGGATAAGGPYGCAESALDAAACMAAERTYDTEAWAEFVRDASDHAGTWPSLLVLHGEDDAVVDPANAELLAAQWAALHEVEVSEDAGPVQRVLLPGVGHAWPVAPEEGCGASAPFLVEGAGCARDRVLTAFGIAAG